MLLVYHAIRRGLEYSSSASSLVKRDGGNGDQTPPLWVLALVWMLAVFFVVFVVAISYTLENLVATLAMVETPSKAISVAPSSHDASPDKAAKQGLLDMETGPDITLVPQKPITASIRGTIRHVVAQGGSPFSRWRAFGSHMIYVILFSFVNHPLQLVLHFVPGGAVLAAGITGALLANVHVAWTHQVTTVGSNKGWWARVLPRADWKLVALPAALQTTSVFLAVWVGQVMSILLGLNNMKEHSGISATFRSLSVVAIFFCCWLFFTLPAHVTLIRVEASLLAEEDDTIVPFDRTFAGKVVPKVLGGTGSVGFVDAWKSFDWEARRRLLWLFAKITGIYLFTFCTIGTIVFLTIFMAVGSSMGF